MKPLKRIVFEEVYCRARRVRAPAERARAVRESAAPKINIGCGRNILPGWVNTDLFPRPGAVWLNAVRPWPFASDLFQAALCEHMIEHVDKASALFLLREVWRTLAPGGWARFITPDPTKFAAHLMGRAPADEDVYLDFLHTFDAAEGVWPSGSRPDWCDALNMIFYGYGHRYIWSPAALSAALQEAGFTDLVVTRAGTENHAVFKDVEGHPRFLNRETGMDGYALDAIEAFAIEAMKPLA